MTLTIWLIFRFRFMKTVIVSMYVIAPTAGSAGPYRERKRSLLEGGIRVPAIWQWVGTIPAGKEG